MNKTIACLGLSASLAFCQLISVAGAQAPALEVTELRSWIEPPGKSYPPGQPLQYRIHVRWRLAQGAGLSVVQTPELENLRCAGYSASQAASSLSNEASAQFRFTLIPLSAGTARIGTTYLESNLPQIKGGQRIAVEGRSLQIGPVGGMTFGRTIGGAAVSALALIGAFLFVRGKRRRHAQVELPSAISPLASVRERLPDLDRLLAEEGGSAFYDQLRDLLMDALKLGGVTDKAVSAGEFSQWLSQQDSEMRLKYGPALALMEQVERVRFAGWTPRPEENRAARKELESVLVHIEETMIYSTKEHI